MKKNIVCYSFIRISKELNVYIYIYANVPEVKAKTGNNSTKSGFFSVATKWQKRHV